MFVIAGRRRTRGQAGRDPFPHGQTRPVDTRLHRSQLEVQDLRDVFERHLGDLRKNKRKPNVRRQFRYG
jgi:hypothetical protein